jgi:hypothetical protein
MDQTRKSRRGAAIVTVLVGLTIVALISLAMTRRQIVRHRFQAQSERDLQAELLVESIRDRVAWRLLSDNSYAGETLVWQPADSGLKEPAEFKVSVQSIEEGWSVTAAVRYGVEEPHLVRRQADWVITGP